jgi:thymidine kinase
MVRIWVLEKRKRVIVASLDGDIYMQPFGQVHMLMCLCDAGAITKLGARCKRCMIRDEPYRHYRLIDAGFTALNNITDKDLSGSSKNIKVGGKDEYRAVCMKCYLELNNKKDI